MEQQLFLREDGPVAKTEPISREPSPFLRPASRHQSPIVGPLLPTERELPSCSQETVSTVDESLLKQVNIGSDLSPPNPFQESPSTTPQANKRKKRKSRRGKGGTDMTPQQASHPAERVPPQMNKLWFDIFQKKQSAQSFSAMTDQHAYVATASPAAPNVEEPFNYVREISRRSIQWMALPLGWALHCIAIYVLPAAIAFGVLAIIAYLLFPRYIFTSIPSIFTTTTTILAFPAQIYTKTPELWCRYVKVGCLMKNMEGEEVMRNATFATDLEVRNAFTVIHNLNSLNNSSNRLVIDSVNIHSVGDAALHLSNWTDRAYIARQFYNLASESRALGKSVTKLEVKGKGVMDHILYLYEQLWIKLEGSWEGKYSAEEVSASRDRLLEEVERELKDLQEHVHITGEIADKALDLAQRVGGEVLRQRGAIASQSAALQASNPWWKVGFPTIFNWDKLTSLQQRTLSEDLQLTAASLSVVDTVKRNLAEMSITLEAFHESVVHARTENRKRTYMGLSVEDLLKSLEENLKRSRREIDAW